jgi:hypothetical protein
MAYARMLNTVLVPSAVMFAIFWDRLERAWVASADGDRVAEETLIQARGSDPSYSPTFSTSLCAYLNSGGPLVSNCVGNNGSDCIQCTGTPSVLSLLYNPRGGTGTVQPAGGSGQCNNYAVQIGECQNNMCQNPNPNGNRCSFTYPYADSQTTLRGPSSMPVGQVTAALPLARMQSLGIWAWRTRPSPHFD